MRRWLRYSLLALAVLLLGSGIAVWQAVRSGWVAEQARRKIVETVERATGGRIEIGAFAFNWQGMEARLDNLVLHGLEGADRAPLFRAQTVKVGLKVLSFWNRKVRLEKVVVEGPDVHIYVDEKGETNLPGAKPLSPHPNAVEDLLRAAIARLEVNHGRFEYARRSLPFDIHAEDIELGLDYDKRGPVYRGTITVGTARLVEDLPFAFKGAVTLEGNRVVVEKAEVARGRSKLQVKGTVTDWLEPEVDATYSGDVVLADVPESPLQEGSGRVEGAARFTSSSGWVLTGRVKARDLAWRWGVTIAPATVETGYRLTRHRLELKPLRVRALGGTWTGMGVLDDWSMFSLDGAIEDLPVDPLLRLRGDSPAVAWNGLISGTSSVDGRVGRAGVSGLTAHASLSIEPSEGAVPVSGFLDAAWSEASQRIELKNSWITTPSAKAEFSGVLGERLTVDASSRNIGELEPVVALFRDGEATKLPLRLVDGEARFHGVVAGPLDRPGIQGSISATHIIVQDHMVDSIEAQVDVAPGHIIARDVVLDLPGARLRGSCEATLQEWRLIDESRLAAAIRLENADFTRLAQEAGVDNVRGHLAGTVQVSGTLAQPLADADISISDFAVAGEEFHKVRGRFRYLDQPHDAVTGTLNLDEAQVGFSGTYTHARADYRRGDLVLSLEGKGFDLKQFENLSSRKPGVAGALEFNHKLRLAIDSPHVALKSLEGKLSVHNFSTPVRRWGDGDIQAWMEGETLRLQSRLEVENRVLQAVAQVRLAADYPIQGKLVMPPLGFRLLRDLAAAAPTDELTAVQGMIEGEVSFQGPITDPSKLTGRAVLTRFLVRPHETQFGETALDVTDLTLRNNGPVQLDLDRKGLHLRTAKFTAKETDLTVSGGYDFSERTPFDLRAEGRVNLAVLSSFKPDLLSSGTSLVNATLRGSADRPQLSGRMEIRGASFLLKGVPNGVEQANGLIFFENDRANIERLTGQTGGGTFEVRGFVGVANREVNYRLQFNVNRVRVRYPEGVSTTLDAGLTLTGTSVRSLLAGTLTVVRSGFNPRTDLASIVAESSRPTPTAATQNEFLQGMQFDIRIRAAPNAELQSSYTRDVQTQADLRLRGSPAKPILLGHVQINQGQVDFLGTRYRISRGEILFYNATSLEPAIDLDLETRVRGVQVSVNFAGPMSKLNVSYRSDPPLRSNDILALLAVGRTPDNSSVALGGTAAYGGATQGTEQGTSTALLGGALSASLNGRLERFFGASRIKIDPQMTSVDNTPQARLTIEQQVTRDVTITFVTNLNRTQQQIWRLEWDLSRELSVIAERDENGMLGVDFQLRKGFR